MWRALAVVALMACGDSGGTPAPDASVLMADAMPDATQLPPMTGLDPAKIGEACRREGWFCGEYAAVCAHAVCREQCSPVEYPLCGDGAVTEVHERLNDTSWCYCVPR